MTRYVRRRLSSFLISGPRHHCDLTPRCSAQVETVMIHVSVAVVRQLSLNLQVAACVYPDSEHPHALQVPPATHARPRAHHRRQLAADGRHHD